MSIERARILHGLDRHEEALAEVTACLAEDPHDLEALAVGARSLASLARHEEAERMARDLVAAAPDDAESHATLASVRFDRGRYRQALSAVNEALRLDPEDADHFALRAALELQLERHAAALESVDAALALDADCASARNIRAHLLSVLARHGEAADEARAALRDDAEDPFAHANLGWTALRDGAPREAQDHFMEALRLDPGSEYAREGFLETLKARIPPYRWLLGGLFFLERLGQGRTVLLFVLVLVSRRLLREAARDNPLFLLPSAILGLVWWGTIMACWYTRPAGDVTLLLHPLARHAIRGRRRAVALAVAGVWVCFCVGIAWGALVDTWAFALAISVTWAGLPLGVLFVVERGWRARAVTGLAVVTLSAVGVAALLHTLGTFPRVTGEVYSGPELALLGIGILGGMLSPLLSLGESEE